MSTEFLNGLVFGFDVGTGSIGYAVRKGTDFKDVGVRICPVEIGDLGGRNTLRRQRRTIQRRSYRKRWFSLELQKLGLTCPSFSGSRDPVLLRLHALRGQSVSAQELYAALTHLWKRRGYLTKVPWGKGERTVDLDDEWENGAIPPDQVRAELISTGCTYPCEMLERIREENKQQKTTQTERKRVWPRELLISEFRAIIKAQSLQFPKLAEKLDWLLYGDGHRVNDECSITYKASQSKNPGLLGVRMARFDNRGPMLDLKTPFDEQGRPQHVARKACKEYQLAQWELALENFRVIETASGQVVTPDVGSLKVLRAIWENKLTKKNKIALQHNGVLEKITVSEPVLKKWIDQMSGRYQLIEGQTKLENSTGEGRARYSRPTLRGIKNGERFDPPQPLLRRDDESIIEASNRCLANIPSLVVRHRLTLFREHFRELIRCHGKPHVVIVEAARDLGMGRKKRKQYLIERSRNEKERNDVRQELREEKLSSSRKALLRYRLWKETGSCCAFCGETINQSDFRAGIADIAHIYPRALIDCNEFYNLTIAHARCNRVEMQNQIPRAAFADCWNEVEARARYWFARKEQARKRNLFLAATNEEAEKLIETKANLSHTAYIATMLRRLCLIELDWLGADGRDPSNLADNKPSRGWQVTNGVLTSRLREAWGINELLHEKPHVYSNEEWDKLSEEERRKDKEAWNEYKTKNRSDHRHHALDAMVIACTLPWLAHRTVGARDPETGECGWIDIDPITKRAHALSPVFPKNGSLRQVAAKWLPQIIVRHHSSGGRHRKTLAATLLSRRVRHEGAEEVFIARKELRKMTPDNLKEIFSSHLREHIQNAWTNWKAEHPDWQRDWKEKTLPPNFIPLLRDPIWNTPILAVKVVVEKSASSVFRLGTHAGGGERAEYFVSYEENKEVRLYHRKNEEGFVAMFVRPVYPKGTGPVKPSNAGMFAFTLRRGMLFEIVNNVKIARSEFAAGIYRVHNLPGEADPRIRFYPHWQHHSPPKSGLLPPLRCNIEQLAPYIRVRPRHEPPHPPPSESSPAGAGKA